MTDLSTTYMGIRLKNPILVGSSSLTGNLEGLTKAEKAGAGGVVLKSLFEEQIQAEVDASTSSDQESAHPEAWEYLSGTGMSLGPRQYLDLIAQAKEKLTIPVIASVNCVGRRWWNEYAQQLSTSGADAVEINISLLPRSIAEESSAIEKYIVDTVTQIASQLTVPFAVKIGPYFTALPRLVLELRKAGAKAVVLFNRFYQMDIDIDNLGLTAGIQFSSPGEFSNVLRWISILHGQCGLDLAAATGIHDGRAIIKGLLAGASVCQMVSTIYRNSFSTIASSLDELSSWMDKHGYRRVDGMIGLLSQQQSDQPEIYERLQYIKALTSID